jgi:anti-sigma factor ChrR (cupin superfamily)
MDTKDSLFTCNPMELKWIPWAMRGASFKLLSADPATGRFSLLIKVEKGITAPVHRHVGAVEGYVLEGGFHYKDAPEIQFSAGCYLLEKDGAVHQPVSQDGAVMFAVFHGAIEGLDGDGKVIGCIDWKWHVDAWDTSIHASLTAHNPLPSTIRALHASSEAV